MRHQNSLARILRWADWENPPPHMEFEQPFSALIKELNGNIDAFMGTAPKIEAPDQEQMDVLLDRAIRIYVQTPALVNVMLNYKICVEHGLPLHPTVYYELREAKKYQIRHSLGEIQHANELFWKSITLARLCIRLSPDAPLALQDFAAHLPDTLETFVYSGVRDKYTWMGSNPELLESLAKKILNACQPRLLVAAAHGSIMPGLLLADLLNIPSYFIRFSMFKRFDEIPIVSLSDLAWLFDYRDKEVVLYDEDVAGGRTLELFTQRLSPLFRKVYTACSIRHAGASIRPDFCGRIWWD